MKTLAGSWEGTVMGIPIILLFIAIRRVLFMLLPMLCSIPSMGLRIRQLNFITPRFHVVLCVLLPSGCALKILRTVLRWILRRWVYRTRRLASGWM